jgi:hypothetical protein
MAKNVAKILDKIEGNLKLQQEKLKLLRENMSCIEYWEDHNDGGFGSLLLKKKQQSLQMILGNLMNCVLTFGILSKQMLASAF